MQRTLDFTPPTAFTRWLGDWLTRRTGDDFAVAGVNPLARMLTLAEVRELGRHCAAIEGELVAEDYRRRLSVNLGRPLPVPAPVRKRRQRQKAAS